MNTKKHSKNINDKFQKALEAFNKGHFEVAENLARKILLIDTKMALAYNLLGAIMLKKNEVGRAINFFKKTIDINPQLNFYNNLALAYTDSNRYDEAIDIYKIIIKTLPHIDDTYDSITNVYRDSNQINDGINYLLQLLEKDPNNIRINNNIANLYFLRKDKENALKFYLKVIELDSNQIHIYGNIGAILRKLDRRDESIEYYEKALSISPKEPSILNNLGNIYLDKRAYDTAIENYGKAIANKENYIEAYNNMGSAYREKGDFEQALNWYNKVIAFDPLNIQNYLDLNKPDKYTVNPEIAEGYFNISTIRALEGNLEKAWEYYQWRFLVKADKKPRVLNIDKPIWDGVESLEGKNIFVYFEQGFGDSILFIRYLKILKSLGANILLDIQKELQDLFEHSGIEADYIRDKNSISSSSLDYYTSLLTLPYTLKARWENIPDTSSYLKADQEKVLNYKQKYFNTDKFKLGICWQGNPDNTWDTKRSLSLDKFYKFAELNNVKLYSLQKTHGEELLNSLPEGVEIINLGQTFNDFSDTAAAIENLDLVLSIDTSVIHLTGALGKKGCLLLASIPDWRWCLKYQDSTPWYNSIKIIRQHTNGLWDDVINEAYSYVKDLSETGSP